MRTRTAVQPLDRNHRSTLSAADWERAALELISEKGVQSLAVEPLARRMGITKGSFYWHFSGRESLLEHALLRWEEHDSRNLNRSLGEIDHPRDRLISFFRRVGREKLTHEVYSALCAAAGHPQVEWVDYPGLPESRFAPLVRRYLPRGCGGILTFGVRGGARAGERFIESVQFLSHLANVGDAKTLVIHPASTTHRQLDEAEQMAAGVRPEMIRLSVGIEDVDDILWDIDQALAHTARGDAT